MRARLAALLLASACLPGLAGAVESGALSYPIVGTNQTAVFDAQSQTTEAALAGRFPGQDATYPHAGPSYVDNRDGTITDTVTGLMWEESFQQLDWSDAEGAAVAATTGGYGDWRVPTIKELYSLIEFSGAQGSGSPDARTPPNDAVPFIDTETFDFEYPSGAQFRYIDVQFVTDTVYTGTVMNGARCFFGVNFADGRIKCYPMQAAPQKTGHYHARFVRDNPDYGVNTFVDNGDGTVTDTATGLIWTQVDSGDPALAGEAAGAMMWEAALDFAQASAFAGHDDWRLPNAKELQSVVDYSRSPEATRSPAIDPIFATTPITDMAGDSDFPTFWTSTSFEPGRDAVVIYFGRALGYFSTPGSSTEEFMDVHGAGAQRTDPKLGEDSYGFGPQGDVRSVRNYVRLVRDAN